MASCLGRALAQLAFSRAAAWRRSCFRPSDPAVVARSGGHIDLVVRGADRVLWHKRYAQEWSDWFRVADDLELEGNPAVTLRSPNQIDVFALRNVDSR